MRKFLGMLARVFLRQQIVGDGFTITETWHGCWVLETERCRAVFSTAREALEAVT